MNYEEEVQFLKLQDAVSSELEKPDCLVCVQTFSSISGESAYTPSDRAMWSIRNGDKYVDLYSDNPGEVVEFMVARLISLGQHGDITNKNFKLAAMYAFEAILHERVYRAAELMNLHVTSVDLKGIYQREIDAELKTVEKLVNIFPGEFAHSVEFPKGCGWKDVSDWFKIQKTLKELKS